MRGEAQALARDEAEVERFLTMTQQLLEETTREEDNLNYTYVTSEDVKGLLDQRRSTNERFLVIHAPKGTTMSVPEKDEKSGFELTLECEQGEILLYRVDFNSKAPTRPLPPPAAKQESAQEAHLRRLNDVEHFYVKSEN
eukprot:TRINITY_DN4048_c0_g1_i1.p2 TRINITY_DN4048_c0_g1~~TRINITY_DN4048_c0_g1_i1.p2  ORF type:complete len:140 (-),score=41.16 TRINITY_DN4048_c0_g1_i1:104-523(-)